MPFINWECRGAKIIYRTYKCQKLITKVLTKHLHFPSTSLFTLWNLQKILYNLLPKGIAASRCQLVYDQSTSKQLNHVRSIIHPSSIQSILFTSLPSNFHPLNNCSASSCSPPNNLCPSNFHHAHPSIDSLPIPSRNACDSILHPAAPMAFLHTSRTMVLKSVEPDKMMFKNLTLTYL